VTAGLRIARIFYDHFSEESDMNAKDCEIIKGLRRSGAALALITAIGCVAPSAARAQDTTSGAAARPGLAAWLRQRLAQRGMARKAYAERCVELSYGSAPLQKLDYWRVTSSSAPLVIFVHGGAWMAGDKGNATGEQKIRHCLEQGCAFASLNYRLYPSATVEEQAHDVAAGVAYLVAHASALGFDPQRVVLMGHSAGAHLAALVSTDLHYLKEAGVPPTALRGVVLLDGAGYDVPSQMTDRGPMLETYAKVFGTDHERQVALSPFYHAAAPNAPAFLILHVQRPDGIAQSRAFAEALRKAGTSVEIRGFEGQGLIGHMEINRRLGDPSYPATPVVDEWLKRVFAQTK